MSHQVSLFAKSVEPPSAERQGSEVLVDGVEQSLGTLEPERHVAHVEVLHVVARLHVVVNLRTRDRNFRCLPAQNWNSEN